MLHVQIFLDEDERIHGKPLGEWVLRFLMHHHIKGATMFRAVMGFGEGHHLRHPTRFGATDSAPLLISFVDETERVHTALKELRQQTSAGAIFTHPVERW
jgi:PII-like signaling protein